MIIRPMRSENSRDRGLPSFLVVLALLALALYPVAALAPTTSASEADSAGFYSDDELRALGIRIVELGANRSLLCSADGLRCGCREPLSCGADGRGCVSFSENVAALRAALADRKSGRTVVCQRGETGRCGEFRYFDFTGDIARQETRWFDNSGRLIFQRNRTDYPAYCDGRSRYRLMGRIPKCSSMDKGERICGTQTGRVPNAIDFLTITGDDAGR